MDHASNFFVATFNSFAAHNSVLCSKFQFCFGFGVSMNAWVPNFKMNEFLFAFIPFQIDTQFLPIEYRDMDVIEAIANEF